MLRRGLDAFVDYAEWYSDTGPRVQQLSLRLRRSAARRALQVWRAASVRDAHLEQLLAHATELRLKRLVLRCMAAWALAAARKQRQRAVLAEVAPKRQAAALAACFRAWAQEVADVKADMVALAHTAERRARHVVRVWRAKCTASRRVAALIRRRTHCRLRDIMRAWTAWAAARRHRRVTCAAAVTTRTRTALTAAWQLWSTAARCTRARTQAVEALVTYAASRRVAAAFKGWMALTEANWGTRLSVFAAWRTCVVSAQSARAIVRDAETRHAEDLVAAVQSAERSAADAQDVVVSTLTSVAKHQVTLHSAAAQAAARDKAATCMAAWRTGALRRDVFGVWRTHCARAAHNQAAVAKRVAAVRHKRMGDAFAFWQQWVRQKRRMRHALHVASCAHKRSQARTQHAILLAWWRAAHSRAAPLAVGIRAADALAARSRRHVLRWAIARWLAGAVEQQRQERLSARADAHWAARRLRATLFAWALHVSSRAAILHRVALMAARDASACQRDAFRAWVDLVRRQKAALATLQIEQLQGELVRLRARYGRLVGAALDDPFPPGAAMLLRSAAATPEGGGLHYVRTPALSVISTRVGAVAAVT
jgi:hypothetical protein